MFPPAERLAQHTLPHLLALLLAACGNNPGVRPSDTLPACSGQVPTLKVDPVVAEAAIGHPDTPAGNGLDPVLLIHGTGSTSFESWGTTYKPSLTAAGYTVYTIDLPGRAYGDIQESSTYLVYALRRIYALTGRPIDVVTHSQGALEPRWAMRWWPDTRHMIDDLVTLGAPNAGTTFLETYCAQGCKPAHWQMAPDSNFLAALNAGPKSYEGVDITNIYSLSDVLVQPQEPESTSTLHGASNVSVQDQCPGRQVDHVGLMQDGAVWAVVIDALSHDGSADPTRVDPLACAEASIPGVNAEDAMQASYYFWTSGGTDLPDTDREPALAPYVCPRPPSDGG